MAYNDWLENPPSFSTRYDVSTSQGWVAFLSRYTAGRPNPALVRVAEVSIANGVQSVLVETRYIDADWRSEHASFYSTTYQRYPSVAHRAHFFASGLPAELSDLSELAEHYRGYAVLRPLASQPLGRVMIQPPPELEAGTRCEAIERVDVLGWPMSVRGMPFISQDAQYLRCAHADLWMVLRHAYLRHQLGRKLPSEIHDATMGGFVVARQIPSDGLSLQQMMAGMSTLGLSPAILPLPRSQMESVQRGSLGLFDIVCRYVNSNISPIIASDSHVWLIVGYTRQASSAHSHLTLYRHDDAAGPYIKVDDPWNEVSDSHKPWAQVMLPLPPKIYMTAERAEATGQWWLRQWAKTASTSNLLASALASNDVSFRTYGSDSSAYKFALKDRVGFDPDLAASYRQAQWPRNLWVVEAVSRSHRDGGSSQNVLGEVIIDPTASHYADPYDPGILAAHAPGFWWQIAPDVRTESTGSCSDDPYESGRRDFSESGT